MKILVCPLDWGLGHAARVAGIIHRLQDLRHEIILCADGAASDFLHAGFPELEMINFPSRVRIRYSRRLPAWSMITLLSPLVLLGILEEHLRMNRLVNRIVPDVIISDNRYGLWNRKARSVLVTHQVSPLLPRFVRFLEYPVYLTLRAFISKFDRCWIPDSPGKENLSGDLSHRFTLPRNAVFTGILTRFRLPDPLPVNNTAGVFPGGRLKLLILISGPEPQRSQLQKIVLKQIFSLAFSCVILQGLPGKIKRKDLTSTVSMYSHLPDRDLQKLLQSAEFILCRAGYSSIMDIALLNKRVLLVPTPGQTEQEYLAGHLEKGGFSLSCPQDELDIQSAIEKLLRFKPNFSLPTDDLLGDELRGLHLL